MNDLNIEHLRQFCTQFRRALVESKGLLTSVALNQFPFGACGDTSMLLGYYLDTKGCGEFEYVLGMRYVWNDEYKIYNQLSHAWLEKDGIAVDLTATQFPFFGDFVHIAPKRKYRMAFDIRRHSPYWACFDGNYSENEKRSLQTDRLWKDYQTIMSAIRNDIADRSR